MIVPSSSEALELPMAEAYFPELNALITENLVHSNSLQQRVSQTAERDFQLKEAKGRALPKLNAYSAVRYNHEKRYNAENEPTNNPQAVVNSWIQLEQPLYRGGEISSLIETAERRSEQTQSELKMRQRALEQDLRRNFLDLQLGLISLKTHALNRDQAQQSVDQQSRLVDQDAASQQSLLEARIRLQEQEERLASDKQTIASAVGQIQFLCPDFQPNLNTTIDSAFADIELLSDADLEAIVTEADLKMNALPEMESLRAQHAAEQSSEEVIASRGRPRFDLITGVSQGFVDDYRSSTSSYESVPQVNLYAGVQLSWNLFDGFQIQNGRLASKQRQRSMQLQQEEMRLRKRAELNTLLTRVNLNIAQIKTRSLRLSVVARNIDVKRVLVDQRQLSEYEYLEEQIRYSNLQIDLYRAYCDYLLQLSQIASFIQ
jgi:outer membrane protein TolC